MEESKSYANIVDVLLVKFSRSIHAMHKEGQQLSLLNFSRNLAMATTIQFYYSLNYFMHICVFIWCAGAGMRVSALCVQCKSCNQCIGSVHLFCQTLLGVLLFSSILNFLVKYRTVQHMFCHTFSLFTNYFRQQRERKQQQELKISTRRVRDCQQKDTFRLFHFLYV